MTELLQNDLKEPSDANTPREEGLFRCYYNTRMLEAWHRGNDPDGPMRQKFFDESRKDAAKN